MTFVREEILEAKQFFLVTSQPFSAFQDRNMNKWTFQRYFRYFVQRYFCDFSHVSIFKFTADFLSCRQFAFLSKYINPNFIQHFTFLIK